MSKYAHLSSSVSHYDLYVDNRQTEDNLYDNEASIASSFAVHLEPCIDVANLLYCKSDIAQAKITSITVNSLPLCYSKTERIAVEVHLPEYLAKSNQFYNTENVTQFNKKPYFIDLGDYISNVANDAVAYLDEKLNVPAIHFILRSTLRIILDTQVFHDDNYPRLSANDLKVLNFYVDVATFTRHIIHKQLCRLASVPHDVTVDQVKFKDAKCMTLANETKYIDESFSLRPINERPHPGFDNSMNLTAFYGHNLNECYDLKDGPKELIESETLRWLNDTMVIDTEDEDVDMNNIPLTTKSLATLKEIIKGNKSLILLAGKTREILHTLEKHIGKKPTAKAQDDLLRLTVNPRTKKLVCTLNSKPFFNDLGVSLTVKMPKHCSKVLWADDGNNGQLIIGPLLYTDQDTAPITTISNQIKHWSQTPAFTIRPIPRVIHVVSDLCQNLKRDFWLRGGKFENCHLLSTISIDDTCMETGFIHIVNPEADNCRLSNSKLLLDRFSVHLIDDRYQKILFQQKTYTSLQINLSPYTAS